MYSLLGNFQSLAGEAAILSLTKSDTSFVDDQWIYPDDAYAVNLDSAIHSLFSELDNFDSLPSSLGYTLPVDSVPPLIKEEIMQRLSVIDSLTPIALEYNKYSARMIQFYLLRRREMLSRSLGLSYLYFPLFEAELSKEGLPVELKHLAIVESALLNVIKSRAGAVGLWQFMYNTGIYLGMDIDSYIDERRDPRVSTKYAVKYLKYLHGLYDDWYMALAAYNAGPGNVNKAIRRSGGKRTFWEIYKYLPRETRSYVPAFIAVNYAMSYAKEYNIRAATPKYKSFEIDTVHITKAVSFDQISEVLCINLDELRFLNPQYKLDFIPVNAALSRFYPLVLPYRLIGEFVTNETVIYSYRCGEFADSLSEDSMFIEKKIIHVVRSGENMGSIANKHDVSVHNIKLWNNLKSSVIHPKQELILKLKGKERVAKVGDSSEKFLYYVIKKGDSLSEIADNHEGVSIRSITQLNGLSRKTTLYPGAKLKIKEFRK